MKNKKVRLFGLMVVLTALLGISVIGCPPKKGGGPVPEPSATVQGMAWDDADGDGVRDPGEAAIPGASMKLIGSTTYGPKNRLSDGTYSFTVTPGGYTLRCSATSFVTQDKAISLSNGDVKIQDFGMRH